MQINIIVINGNVKNWQEAISITSQTLHNKGFVKKEFSQACINREKEYPTGIPSGIPFAIPHAEGEYVYEESLCVLRLEEPVEFSRMDNPDSTVDVRLVINLAIQKSNNQVLLLKKLMEAFMQEDFVNHCIDLPEEQVNSLFADILR